jgi:hypothetical protein
MPASQASPSSKRDLLIRIIGGYFADSRWQEKNGPIPPANSELGKSTILNALGTARSRNPIRGIWPPKELI